MDSYLPKLINLFSQFEEIKLVYLFGSQVTNKISSLSDYDFAIYLDEKTLPFKKNSIKIELIANLMQELKTNDIDLVILNDALNPLLKYEIIYKKNILYEKQPYKIKIESIILNQYLDFYTFMDKKSYD